MNCCKNATPHDKSFRFSILIVISCLLQCVFKIEIFGEDLGYKKYLSYIIFLMNYSFLVGIKYDSIKVLKTFKFVFPIYLLGLTLYLIYYGISIFINDYFKDFTISYYLSDNDDNSGYTNEQLSKRANLLLILILIIQIIYLIISYYYYYVILKYVDELKELILKEEELLREMDNVTLVDEQVVEIQDLNEDKTMVNVNEETDQHNENDNEDRNVNANENEVENNYNPHRITSLDRISIDGVVSGISHTNSTISTTTYESAQETNDNNINTH